MKSLVSSVTLVELTERPTRCDAFSSFKGEGRGGEVRVDYGRLVSGCCCTCPAFGMDEVLSGVQQKDALHVSRQDELCSTPVLRRSREDAADAGRWLGR